jgi:hypothetical protein
MYYVCIIYYICVYYMCIIFKLYLNKTPVYNPVYI